MRSGLRHGAARIHEHALGEFEDEIARVESGLPEDCPDRVDDTLLAELPGPEIWR